MRGQASKHTRECEPTLTQTHTHLLIDGGVAPCSGHPNLFVETVTDGIAHVYAGVLEGAENCSRKKRKHSED